MSVQKTTQKTVKDAGKAKGGKRLMIDTNDFNITKWSNTDIDFEDEKNKNSNQFTCYGRYNYGKESSPVNNQLVFKTGPVKLVTYGIPQLGQYAKTDKERQYVKIPFDKTQESCVSLFKMFEALDSWAVKNKDKFFTGKLSKFAKIYDYTSIVRKPQEAIALDDDGDEEAVAKKPQGEKPLYAKLRISTNWQTGEVDTTVFVREDGTPVKHEVKTVTDMAEVVTWQSTIQMICSCNKIWFGKSADKSGRRQFGLSFKILQCEVTEKVSGGAKSDFSSYAFDDSVQVETKEDEDEENTKKTVTKKVESESEDSEDDSENEKEDKKAVTAKKVESESESESEDEKPAKGKKQETKGKGKKVVESESESESSESDSEDEKPAPKPAAKKTAKSSK